MSQTRVAVFDLSLGLSALVVAASLVCGGAMGWLIPEKAIAFRHPLIDDFFLAFFLFSLGVRSTFITRTVLFGPGQSQRYFLSRGLMISFIGALLLWWTGLQILLVVGVIMLLSVVLSQLNSTILYFLAFSIGLVGVSAPVLADSQTVRGMGFLAEFLFLKADSFAPWAMFFIFGTTYGRYDLLDKRWMRFVRVLSLLVLLGAVFTYLAIDTSFDHLDFFAKGSRSRLPSFSIYLSRPVFILAAIPAGYLFFQACTYLAERKWDNWLYPCVLRFGQFHVSLLTLALIFTGLLPNLIEVGVGSARLLALLFIAISFVFCMIFRKHIRNAPVEWLMQRFY